MKAITARREHGAEVLDLSERPRPEPGLGEILVAVSAASVLPTATMARRAGQVPGLDVAGVVAAIGPEAGRYRVGERVHAVLPAERGGGWAELAVAPQSATALLPPELSFTDGAAVAGAGVLAVELLRGTGALERGRRVLVLGAATATGRLAVQLAARSGAVVTAWSALEDPTALWGLGAAYVLAADADPLGRGPYDVVLDAAGTLPLAEARRGLAAEGALATAAPVSLGSRLLSRGMGARLVGGPPSPDGEVLASLGGLARIGRLAAGRAARFPLEDGAAAVAEADRLEGPVVLEIARAG